MNPTGSMPYSFGPSPSEPHYSPEEQARIQAVDTQPPKPTKWTDFVLTEIEWKRFEVVTKEFLKMTGYEAQETRIGADGGVDIRVTKSGVVDFKGIVQCKAWNSYKVGVKPVRELFGVMAAEKASTGMFITSGDFTTEAEDFANGRITLVSGSRFLALIKKMPDDNQRNFLKLLLRAITERRPVHNAISR